MTPGHYERHWLKDSGYQIGLHIYRNDGEHLAACRAGLHISRGPNLKLENDERTIVAAGFSAIALAPLFSVAATTSAARN